MACPELAFKQVLAMELIFKQAEKLELVEELLAEELVMVLEQPVAFHFVAYLHLQAFSPAFCQICPQYIPSTTLAIPLHFQLFH